MQKLQPEEFVQEILVRIGFEAPEVKVDEDRRRASILLDELPAEELHEVIQALNALAARHAERSKESAPFFDVNGYRAKREDLIAALAAAAAERVIARMESVSLPAMNSYERRLVHEKAASLIGVHSESAGLGKERHVVLFPRQEGEEAGS